MSEEDRVHLATFLASLVIVVCVVGSIIAAGLIEHWEQLFPGK